MHARIREAALRRQMREMGFSEADIREELERQERTGAEAVVVQRAREIPRQEEEAA